MCFAVHGHTPAGGDRKLRITFMTSLQEEKTGASGQGEDSGKRDLKSMDLEELTRLIREKGLPAFRAKQIFQWLHVRHVRGYEEMTNLPAALRQSLAGE